MLRLFRRVLGKDSRTRHYPKEAFVPPAKFRGRPEALTGGCDRCGGCATVCPAGALALVPEGLQLDLSRCVFCGECARACPEHIVMGKEFELAARDRGELKVVLVHG
jgi:formate hydrogenlyase subunit 6/NADH:ubiquinone oxidoreductase subunit I